MSISAKVTKNGFKDFQITFDRQVELAVRDVSFETKKQINAFITKPPGGGSPTARADERSGLVDTGNYRRSWTAAQSPGSTREWHTWIVGSPVEYGVYLEFGTRRMPAYPHVKPAADKITNGILAFFRGLGR